VQQLHAALRVVLADAVRLKVTTRNPLAGVKAPLRPTQAPCVPNPCGYSSWTTAGTQSGTYPRAAAW